MLGNNFGSKRNLCIFYILHPACSKSVDALLSFVVISHHTVKKRPKLADKL